MASTIKPGPLNSNWIMLPTTIGGGGQAAQIVGISNLGTSGAIATVRILDASGFLSNDQYANVYIIPEPQFATTGDRGSLTSYTPSSGLATSTIRYLQISRQSFLVY